MEEEYAKTPKDINRNQYQKRINEVIENLKSSKQSIKQILVEIKDIQNETIKITESMKRLDEETENLVF